MKKLIMFIFISSFIFSQSATVDKGKWKLLGAVSDIDITKSFSEDCYIYAYKNGAWEKYNPTTKDITNITVGKGFWLHTRSVCNFDTDSTPDNAKPKNRFTSLQANSQITMLDNTTGLEWVNGYPGCKPTLYKTELTAFNESKAYCEALDYASKTDWELPFATEAKTFLVEMNNLGLTPYYTNKACPRLIGLNPTRDTIQGVNTHNTSPIGLIHDFPNSNAGIRCVRRTR